VHWIDPVQPATVSRVGDPAVLLSLPLSPAGTPRSLSLAPGRVWFAAGPRAAAAAGGCAGLRGQGGPLTCDHDLDPQGGHIEVAAAASVTLTVTLTLASAHQQEASAEEPAADQRAAAVAPPETVTINLAPAAMALVTDRPATLVAYGVTARLSPTGGPVAY